MRAAAVRTLLIGCLGFAAAAPARAASGPGQVLREYLQARLQGRLDAAKALWDARDLRRASALGITFADVEASYDDYWMQDGAARKALTVRPVVRDSVEQAADKVHFTVVLEASAAPHDTLRYLVQQVDGVWRVSLPYLEASREWTRRESRFVRVRSKKLTLLSQHALTAMDDEIVKLFAQLETPQAAQLRLERIKLEYYLCDADADVRSLVGSVGREGYQPAGGRVVARVLPDMNAVARLLVHLTLRDATLHSAPMFVDGLAAALGGSAELGAGVYLQRARAAIQNEASRLSAVFDPQSADDVPVQALWCKALLDELGSQKFLALVRAQPPGAGNSAARASVETAMGAKNEALLQKVQQRVGQYGPTIQPGCETWPGEIQGLQPILRWRDTKDTWGLLGYEIGEDYVFTVAAHDPSLPKWQQRMIDSLAANFSGEKPTWEIQEVKRPVGDPGPIVVLVRARLEEDLEPYESRLFGEHFLQKDYRNDLYGLFITPDDVRFYDYTRNMLLAEYSVKSAPAGGLVYYDEPLGQLCFRLPKKLLPRHLTTYYVFLSNHTGE
ncbi:MAG TPA: hypothetical protein VFD07_08925 [Candidatus Krumholzibacteria bacterium]|nr:hypothetical protein [Candidatus Krumholzibacteria bacterium]